MGSSFRGIRSNEAAFLRTDLVRHLSGSGGSVEGSRQYSRFQISLRHNW